MKLTKSAVEKLGATGTRYEVRDDELKGFLVRVGATGDKAFYYLYRAGKGRAAPKKRLHIGNFPKITVEQARQIVQKKAAQIALGGDPAQEVRDGKTALRMNEALQQFQEEKFSTLKPMTITGWSGIIKNRIIPSIGKLQVKDVGYSQVAKIHHGMRNFPGQANITIAILSVFFKWCERHGYRERNSNPCQDIKKYKENKRLEFMGETELAILGNALDLMERTWYERKRENTCRSPSFPPRTFRDMDSMPSQLAAAIRLLMVTGTRKGEILSLEWSRIDLQQGIARLPDSKTGFKVVQLTAPALAILNSLPKTSKWVFPSPITSSHIHCSNIDRAWWALLKQAGLSGWRIHDLRHAFASMMVNGGASLPIIGKILGHSNTATTQRYAHLEQNPARKAAEDAAAKIAQAWKAKPTSNVLQFPKAQ